MWENVRAQQIKLEEIRVAIRTATPIFLGEELKARKKKLVHAIRENWVAQKIKLDEIKAAAEIEKDSQRVIDLKIELRNLRYDWRRLITEVKTLGPREEEGKEHIVSSEGEETLSA
jgi:hypothetical protein